MADGDGKNGSGSGDQGANATVSKADLDAALARIDALQRQNADLAAKVESGAKQPEPPKQYTRAELDTAVAQGRMTQAQADEIIERQIENRVVAAATGAVTAATGAQKIGAQIDAYTVVIPDVMKDGSDSRKRVEREYQAIVAAEREINPNFKPTKATELQALRAAFGPIEAVKRGQQLGERETIQDIGGSGGQDRGGGGDADGPPKGMPADRVRYYQDLINKGQYRDWKDVESVEKFRKARPSRAA